VLVVFFLESFVNAYVGELITEEMATKRDFKYLAILDHKSHLHTTDNKKRKAMKKSFNDVRVVVNGKNYFSCLFQHDAIFIKYEIYYRRVITFFSQGHDSESTEAK